MNCNPTRILQARIACALGILFLAQGALAQAPEYIPPPPPTKHTTFELRLRYLFKPDVSFSGLGSIPLRESFQSSNNIIDGSERSILYDDGYIAQDYIRKDLIEGGTGGSQVVPSENTAASSNFSYINPDQVDRDADPSLLNFHRYSASAASDAQLEGTASGSMGWELNYTKYINRRRNLGIQVGFSFNGFDSRFNDTIEADLNVITYSHRMEDGDVPQLVEVVDDDGNITYETYIGEVVRNEDDELPLLNWDTEGEPVEELIEGGALVESRADLRSSMYNFRAGPTYNVSMGKTFGLQLGAGISAQFIDGRFAAFETLTNLTTQTAPTRFLTTTEESEWQVGGYLDASAFYNLSERISVFSGMQVQSGNNYSHFNDEREANIDFSSQVYVHAGMGIRF